MSKVSDEGEKDRLTSEEFVDLIPHLSFANILEIEFLANNWKPLINSANSSKKVYRCNLCNITLSGYKSVCSHISGRKHIGNMTGVKFYHPEYTFTKAQLSKAVGKEKNKAIENTKNTSLQVEVPSEKSNEAQKKLPEKNTNSTDGKKIDLQLKKNAENVTETQNKNEINVSSTKQVVDKPCVRLVPINKLKDNTKVVPAPTQKKEDESLKPKIQTTKTTVSEKAAQSDMIPEEKQQQNKEPMKISDPKNLEDQEKLSQKSERVVNNKIVLNINKSSETARKLVKNPLAAINTSASLQKTTPNVSAADVIVIDDVEDSAQSKNKDRQTFADDTQSKGNNIPSITTDSDPPAKRQKISPLPAVKVIEAEQTNKKSETHSRSNLVPIPTKAKSNPINNKDKPTDEPAFAVKSVADAIANDKIAGFVGVEYVIKICRNSAPPKYECGLCELVLDGQSMQNHLLGYTHRLKFCEKHFPTAIQQFRQYILNVPQDEHYKVMIPVLQKLTVAIEEHHGRSLPFECNERRYNLERHRVLTEVFARRHASEQRGPTFTHVVDSKQVDEFILKKDSMKLQPSLNKITFDEGESVDPMKQKLNQEIQRPPHTTQREFYRAVKPYECNPMGIQPNVVHPFRTESNFMDDETHKRMVDNFLKANNTSGGSAHKSSRSNRSEREPRYSQFSKRSHSPRKESHSSLNIWSSYCRLVDNKLKGLRENFQQYRSNPESHPSYKQEWLKFWQRRKAELMAMGRDYRSYDFQPDWVPYFNNRINELYDEAFEKLKIEAREELSLPMINDYLCDPKYFVHVKPENYITATKKVAPPANAIETNMSTKSSYMNLNASTSYKFNQERTLSPTTNRRQLIIPNETHIQSSTKDIEIKDEPAPTVVSVLRLLTALEEYLGSLGPKIVELLSKALQAEKCSQGRAQVLLTEENCTVLETAMEKFKGLLIAGILDAPKERALKKAITKVGTLLDNTREIREKQISYKGNTSEPIASKNDLIVDKQKSEPNINDKLKQALQTVSNANDISNVIHLIEEKIAASLKAQGRTDVDRAHLEQLAAVCVLLEKKKREAGALQNQNAAHSSALQHPLSDTLKKIVNSVNSEGNNQTNQVHPSAAEFNINRIANVSEAKQINNSSLHGFKSTTNISELNKFNNNGNSKGNFSNQYSKNNNSNWMAGDTNSVGNSQVRAWHPPSRPQQSQQNIPSSLGWPQSVNRTWIANESLSASGVQTQRASYQNNFGQKPSAQPKYRYN